MRREGWTRYLYRHIEAGTLTYGIIIYLCIVPMHEHCYFTSQNGLSRKSVA